MLRFLRVIGNDLKRRTITFNTTKTISISKQNDKENSSIYAFKQYDNVLNESNANVNFVSNSNEESNMDDYYLAWLNGDFKLDNNSCFGEKLYRKNENPAKFQCLKSAPFVFSFACFKDKIIFRKQIDVPLSKVVFATASVIASAVLLPKILRLLTQSSKT